MSIQIVFEAVDKAALATLQKVAKGVDGVTDATKRNQKETSLAGDVWGNLVGGMTAANLISGAITKTFQFLAQQLKESVKAAQDAELALARTEATLLSTGRAAEISGEALSNIAMDLSSGTMFDDEQILEAMNALARYESVATSALPDVTRAAMDMAAALGTDVPTAANQLGGALETGVIPRAWKFDAATKSMIKSLIEEGKESEALGVILDKLGGKFEGQAEIMGSTTAGGAAQAKNALDNLKEEIGEGMLPRLDELYSATIRASDGWRQLFTYINNSGDIGSKADGILKGLGKTADDIGDTKIMLGFFGATQAEEYTDRVKGLTEATDEEIAAAENLARIQIFGAEAMRAGEISAAQLTEKIATLGKTLGMTPEQIQSTIDVVIKGEKDLEEVQQTILSLGNEEQFNFIMSFQSNFDNFEKDRDELIAKMEETRDKILAVREQMAAGTMKQSDGTSQIAELSTEMDSLSDQVNQNKKEWEQWQNQAIFSIIQTKLAADGLSDVEFDNLLKIGEDMGILDPAVVENAKKTMDEVNKILNGGDANADKNAAVTGPLNVIKEITPDTMASVQGIMTAITGVDPGNLEAATDNIKYLVAQDGRTIKIYVEQTTTTVSGTTPTTSPATSTTSALNTYAGGGVTLINYGTIRVDSLDASDLLAEFR